MILSPDCLGHKLNATSIRTNFENFKLIFLILSTKQKTNSKRSLSTSKSFASKFLSQFPSNLIYSHLRAILESMFSIFDSHVFDYYSGISCDATDSHTCMLVDLEKLLLITGKFWRVFLDCQKYYSFFGLYS